MATVPICRPVMRLSMTHLCTETLPYNLRDPVREERHSCLFKDGGVPRSAAESWIRRGTRPVISAEILGAARRGCPGIREGVVARRVQDFRTGNVSNDSPMHRTALPAHAALRAPVG